MEIRKLIDEVTTQTVVKLKKSGLISNHNVSVAKKTENILKNYNKFKIAIANDKKNTVKTQTLIKIINEALKTIEDDPYYKIVEMFYFKRQTIAEIAEYFNVDDKTISRNKKRLINEIKYIIFSDKTIEEIFL